MLENFLIQSHDYLGNCFLICKLILNWIDRDRILTYLQHFESVNNVRRFAHLVNNTSPKKQVIDLNNRDFFMVSSKFLTAHNWVQIDVLGAGGYRFVRLLHIKTLKLSQCILNLI